jgi:hypothetical protein
MDPATLHFAAKYVRTWRTLHIYNFVVCFIALNSSILYGSEECTKNNSIYDGSCYVNRCVLHSKVVYVDDESSCDFHYKLENNALIVGPSVTSDLVLNHKCDRTTESIVPCAVRVENNEAFLTSVFSEDNCKIITKPVCVVENIIVVLLYVVDIILIAAFAYGFSRPVKTDATILIEEYEDRVQEGPQNEVEMGSIELEGE